MFIDDCLLSYTHRLENEIDGLILLKLSESMVARLFPTIKLEVQFLDLLQSLKQQQHLLDLNSNRSSSFTNGLLKKHQISGHIVKSSSFDNRNSYSSNLNPSLTMNGHYSSKLIYSERALIPKGPPLKALKRESKYFSNQTLK